MSLLLWSMLSFLLTIQPNLALAQDEPLRIGIVAGTFSDPQTLDPFDALAGSQISGRQIEIVKLGVGTQEQAITATQRLVEQDEANIIVTEPWFSESAHVYFAQRGEPVALHLALAVLDEETLARWREEEAGPIMAFSWLPVEQLTSISDWLEQNAAADPNKIILAAAQDEFIAGFGDSLQSATGIEVATFLGARPESPESIDTFVFAELSGGDLLVGVAWAGDRFARAVAARNEATGEAITAVLFEPPRLRARAFVASWFIQRLLESLDGVTELDALAGAIEERRSLLAPMNEALALLVPWTVYAVNAPDFVDANGRAEAQLRQFETGGDTHSCSCKGQSKDLCQSCTADESCTTQGEGEDCTAECKR